MGSSETDPTPRLTLIEAVRRLRVLSSDLRQMIERDPEQEITGAAVDVVDAAIEAGSEHVALTDPIYDRIRGVWTAWATEGTPRASDTMIVVNQLKEALEAKIPTPRPVSVPKGSI